MALLTTLYIPALLCFCTKLSQCLPRSLRQVHPLVAELEWTEEAYQPEAMPEPSAGRLSCSEHCYETSDPDEQPLLWCRPFTLRTRRCRTRPALRASADILCSFSQFPGMRNLEGPWKRICSCRELLQPQCFFPPEV